MKNTQVVNLRVIAIVFVVFGHSIIIFDPRWGTVFLYLNLIAKWSVFFYTGFVISQNYRYLKNQIPKGFWLGILFSLPLILVIRFNVDFPVIDSAVRFIFSILLILSAYYFIPNETKSLIKYLDKNSYGIYLLHAPIVYIMYDNLHHNNPFTLITLTFIAFFLGALLITELIRRLQLTFIIGEFKTKKTEKIIPQTNVY